MSYPPAILLLKNDHYHQKARTAMQIKMLSAFDVPQNIITLWEKTYGENLLPIQERAVKEFKLLQGTNLVVFAPTSSGKTFIGEIAVVASASKKKKVFYLLPMKALAEEKYNEFRENYLPSGIHTVISTRDRQEYDSAIIKGDYNIALIVFEKLNALLVSKPSLLEDVGLLIIDELQMLGDEERGPALEMLLTKVLQTKSRPQLLGLSAVLGEAKELASWLGAELLVEHKRPVELRKGVFYKDTFYYQEHNSRIEDAEKWAEIYGRRKEDTLWNLAAYLSGEKNESTILFLPDKATVDGFAAKLRDIVTLSPVDDAIAELLRLEESVTRDFLIFLLKKGIAVHHADLSWDQREVIERYARSGSIKLLLSTTTLGLGMNMPFKNAVLDHRRWRTFKRPKDIRLTDKTKSQLENEGGRVARFGFIPDFGRAILVTDSAFEKDVWMNYYIRGSFEKISPAVDESELREYILQFIACDYAHTKDDVKSLLKSTYTAKYKWEHGDDKYDALISDVITSCLRANMLISGENETFAASDIGKLCAQKGIKVRTALWFSEWMENTDPDKFSELELLFTAALSEDGQEIFAPFKKWDYDKKRWLYRSLFQKETQELQEEEKWVYSLIRTQRFLDYTEVKAIKEALFLSEWVTNTETSEIEQKYFAPAGAIQKTAQEFSWLLEALSRMAELKGWKTHYVQKLQELSRRLIYGVTKEGLALSSIRIPGFTRGYITRLVREGYDSPDALKDANLELLKKHIPEALSLRLLAYVHGKAVSEIIDNEPYSKHMLLAAEKDSAYVAPQTETPVETSQEPPQTNSQPAPVHFDPTSCTLALNLLQYRAYFKGVGFILPKKCFEFLLHLADHPGKVIPRKDLCRKIYPGEEIFPSDEGLKMNNLKYKCIRRLKRLSRKHKHIKKDEISDLIFTKRSRGYMLNLPREEILIVR